MLFYNIFKTEKIVSFLSLFFILSSLLVFFLPNETQANYSSNFKKYPGYEELLKKLQTAHPKWEFEIVETGLDWSEVIIAESTGHHGRNVVPSSKSSAWKCSCGKTVDVSWVCASTSAVAYYMDPRNSLNEDYIFQFEQLTYDPDVQSVEGVKQILSDCNYMQGKITYYDSKGKKYTLDKTYVDVIMEAAKEYNVSPYHLASKIRQEQGTGDAGSMITGTYKSNKGYYNYFNVGAWGSTTEEILKRGLENAKNKGWDNPEKSIKGGAATIVKDYISCGQDTLYFEKFDVVVPEDGLYSFQYMTNVSGSMSEGLSVREAYDSMGLLKKDAKIKFKIPVYKNMPNEKSAIPGTEKIVTQDVQINENAVYVRKGKGTNYDAITTLNKGTKLLRIELDNAKDSKGRYWDKVVLSDGKKGYVSRQYLTQIAIQSNCKEKYVVSAYTNFRNGPGTEGTTVIDLLPPGRIVTVVEKGKYKKLNGEEWYRVQLENGTYGYVGTGYITEYNPEKNPVEKVRVVCSDGLNIRKEPSTSANVLETVTKGTILTRTEKDVKSSDKNYIWDRVTSPAGTVGYVVRQDPSTKKAWIEPLEENSSDNNNDDEKTENKFKVKDTSFISIPNVTVEEIQKEYKEATIKDASNKSQTKGNVGTGWKVTIDGKTYAIIVLGDLTGDGKATTVDAARALKTAAKKYELKGVFAEACDVTGDGKVTTVDAARILKIASGKYQLSV